MASNNPWSKQSPAGPWDYVVVGSGMGGMTTASLLSRLGKRVLVLEQHYTAGGFTHTFKRPGYRWDVGVHAVGEVTAHSMTGRLLELMTDGKLQWTSLGENYDQLSFPGGFRFDIPDNPRQLRRNLVEAFPKERQGVRDYFQLVKEVARGMRGYFLARTLPPRLAPLADPLLSRKVQPYLEQTTEQVLQRFTTNQELQAVLTAQWGYYGSVPSRSAFAIQAMVVNHFAYGAFYPVGGAGRMAEHMLQGVADAGGWTRINADVEEILIEGGKAVGVRLTDGEEIRAERVVSAAGIGATARRLLPERYRTEPWAQEVGALTPGPAYVCLHLGFKGDITAAGATPANRWFYRTWGADGQSTWNVTPDGELSDAPCVYVSFPSIKDPEHDAGPEERHTGEVVTFVPWSSFAQWRDKPWKKRGADYEDFKRRIQERLLEQVLSELPGLRPMVDYVELSTPVTTDTFCRPLAGSAYGLEPTPERFRCPWLRARSPIPNLFFSGCEVTSAGIMGALMGGVLAALAAEPVRATQIVRQIW
ncbi:MAG: NAD(P)/FAD-dependent oxidoreductase [Deltaproteobacteria bacterium]|nr:NAD(P)/FAD-dependent oxidoreductase [Deltaproteobacteria bacterium]